MNIQCTVYILYPAFTHWRQTIHCAGARVSKSTTSSSKATPQATAIIGGINSKTVLYMIESKLGPCTCKQQQS